MTQTRRLRTHLTLIAACVARPTALGAQTREVQKYGPKDPEGKLILYYSSGVAFSGISDGAPRRGALDIGLEVSYLPPLTESQRSINNDKSESTNLAPVLPRPRASYVTPGNLRVEVSWLPPLKVFGVTANMLAGAVSYPLFSAGPARVVGRVAAMTGRVTGPITCNEDLTKKSADHLAYYSLVCHGRESEDHFEPRHVMGELIASPRPSERPGRFRPFIGVGARREHTKFDVGVMKTATERDHDNPILDLRATRPYGFVGTGWQPWSRLTIAGELYYMPGSLLTARTRTTLHLR